MPMTEEDLLRLNREILATAEVMGQSLSPSAAALIASDIEDSGAPWQLIQRALRECRTRQRARLSFALIRECLDQFDGRPDREEAWSLALLSMDERESVVWTVETRIAFESARPVLQVRDKVAARMAFLSAYDRLVKMARDERRPCEWVLSQGWDAERRVIAVEQAKMRGLITHERAQLMIGHDAPDAVTADGRALLSLVAGGTSLIAAIADESTRAALEADQAKAGKPVGVSASMNERLGKLRDQLRARSADREKRRAEMIERERQALQQKKEAAIKAVKDHERGIER